MHTYIYAYTYTLAYMHMSLSIHPSIHTYIHTYIHTRTHKLTKSLIVILAASKLMSLRTMIIFQSVSSLIKFAIKIDERSICKRVDRFKNLRFGLTKTRFSKLLHRQQSLVPSSLIKITMSSLKWQCSLLVIPELSALASWNKKDAAMCIMKRIFEITVNKTHIT